jgi:hypothetical protein
LMVVSHPARRHRQAVTSEIPACLQNLLRLIIGPASTVEIDPVFIPGDYESPPDHASGVSSDTMF